MYSDKTLRYDLNIHATGIMSQELTFKNYHSLIVKEIQASLVIRSYLDLRLFRWQPFNNNLKGNEKLRSNIVDAWPVRILGEVAVLATPHMNSPLGEQENKL